MEILKVLHHPNLVKLYCIVTEKFAFYIVTVNPSDLLILGFRNFVLKGI